MATAATIRIAPAIVVIEVARAHGADPAALLASVGWSASLLENPDTMVAYASLGRLVEEAIRATGCEHLPLLVGKAAGPQALGAVGLAARYSSTVAAALELLIKNFALHDRGAVLSLRTEGAVAALRYRVVHSPFVGSQHIAAGMMAIGLDLMRTLCGPNWQPLQTHLAQRRPADIRPYQAVFGEAVSFDAEDAALFFDAAWLAHPVAGADAELQRLLLGIVNGGAGNAARTFRDDVRALLAGMIGDADVSQATVARIFNISSSTLHRRLAAEGTNFQDLLDDTRADIACRLLGDTTLPLAQISSMLGYSEASAFTRWFKRRMGAAPTDWRATRTGAHAAAAAQ